MKILFATSEALPYWKSGGLADVSRALPDALAARGHDVLLIHPYYPAVRERGLQLWDDGAADLPWPGGAQRVRYLRHEPERGAPALLTDHPLFTVRHPYGPLPDDPHAAGVRFALFCRATVERARSWRADVVHVNDWGAGLVPVYASIDGMAAPSVFAIHNLAYQGNFPPELLDRVGISREWYRTEGGAEFYGAASFMKAGLALADRIVTVSPTYAREIQTPEGGAGFDGLLRHRADALTGILNGIDPGFWNPAEDPAIHVPYDAGKLDERERNRAAVLEELGLDPAGPLVVMITRLAFQKGVDLVLDALDGLVAGGVRLAILGDGDAALEARLGVAAERSPDRVAAIARFDDALARRLYAGADFFLMPSRYEPCGLGQIIAQRYGAVPIVRRTGGLADTVEDGRTGFLFDDPSPAGVADAVLRAARVWRAEGWDDLRRRCMALDRSWDRSAARYENVYRLAAG